MPIGDRRAAALARERGFQLIRQVRLWLIGGALAVAALITVVVWHAWNVKVAGLKAAASRAALPAASSATTGVTGGTTGATGLAAGSVGATGSAAAAPAPAPAPIVSGGS